MKQKNYNIPTVVYFVVTALLIAYFFPREGKFRYQFYEGKPWRYGLLTAPSDFPIYKTDDEVKAEKDSTATNVAGIYSGCPDLVIDGTITVDGSSGSKGTNAAIRIAEGTTTIKDGYFTVGTDASGIANSCILVATARPSQKAHLKIYGGVFETKGNPINGWYPVINIQDADRKAGRATVEIYGGIFINYNPATGDNTGEADDTFVAPGYKSVETTYNGQQAWQVIPE